MASGDSLANPDDLNNDMGGEAIGSYSSIGDRRKDNNASNGMDDDTSNLFDKKIDEFLHIFPIINEGNTTLLLQILESNRDNVDSYMKVCDPDYDNITPLKYAIKKHKRNCIQVLLGAHCRFILQDDSKKRRDRFLHQLASVIDQQNFSKTANVIKTIKKKLLKNILEKEKHALLVFAVCRDCPVDIFEVLVLGLNVDYLDLKRRSQSESLSLLTAAIILQKLDIVHFICSRGPQFDNEDVEGGIINAIESGSSSSLEMLVNVCKQETEGTNILSVLHKGITFAVHNGGDGLSLSILLKRIDEIQSCDNDSIILNVLQKSLMTAASTGNISCMQVILERRGIDLAWTNAFGETALMCSIIHDQYESFELLLQHGAHIDNVDCEGNSALMHAVQRVHTKFVSRLLELQIFIDVTDNSIPCSIAQACCLNDADTEMLANMISILRSHDVLSKLNVQDFMQAFNYSFKFYNIGAMVLLMENHLFKWNWLDNNETISPELISQAAVRSGIRPGIFYWGNETMTLLKHAFYFDSHATVRFLLANHYLDSYDIKVLSRDKDFSKKITRNGSAQLQELLRHLTMQPLSLKSLSILTTSFAINAFDKASDSRNSKTKSGNGAQQQWTEDCIQRLPIPRELIDRLVFKSSLAKLCVDKWKDIGIGVKSLTSSDTSCPNCLNLMSYDAPFWRRNVSLPPEVCPLEQCSNNALGFRSRFLFLNRRRFV